LAPEIFSIIISSSFPRTYQIVYQFTRTEQKTLDNRRIYGPAYGTSLTPLIC